MAQVNTNAVTRRKAYVEAMESFRLEPVIIPLADATTWDFERFAFDEASRLLGHPKIARPLAGAAEVIDVSRHRFPSNENDPVRE
ncbi:hypothetical protein ACLJYM_27075 [Rhizobium giardinii]|uniref:hypothetical protein n=1 Tax=Rhizobium giardinii TaxID=56731 RepID=UPI0039E0850E